MIHSVHILVIDSGVPLLSTQFDERSELDETLASGLFAALRSFATEVVDSEEDTEPEIISLSGFKIIYATEKNLACVALVDNAISDPALVRDRLKTILDDFMIKYENALAEIPFVNLQKFSGYDDSINKALDCGRYAHEPQAFPMLKDKTKLSRLIKMGFVKKQCLAVAELSDGTKTVNDIARILQISQENCDECIKKLQSQKILEIRIEGDA